MTKRKRNSFSSDFKAKVALEAIHGVKTLNEIGQEFGVHPVQVGKWKKELQEQASRLFEMKRGPKPVEPSADPEKLYTEIGRLKVELDLLKKSPGSPNEGAQSMDQRKWSTIGCAAMRVGRHQSVDILCSFSGNKPGCRRGGTAGFDRQGIHPASVLWQP